jgi:reactive intermediate/imine deaminase
MSIVEGGVEAQAHQVFRNLRAVMAAAGGSMDDIVKVSILMTNLGDFAKVNDIMATYFTKPYPARATYQVAALPRGAMIEIEGTAVLPGAGTTPATGWRETFDQTKGQ